MPHSYGCVMANFPPESEIATLAGVYRAALQQTHFAGDGPDVGPDHVTVRFGIESTDANPAIEGYLMKQAPFTVRLGKASSFPPSESSGGAVVLKVDVESEDLHRINKELGDLGGFTDPDFEYHPHMTLAYLKEDYIEDYMGETVFDGLEYEVTQIVISNADHTEIVVGLSGNTTKTAAPLTPQLKSWFGASVVKDSKGNPLPVYHGTTHDFDTFSSENGNNEGHYGAGLYFTSSGKDAADNYAGEGPDLTSRISNRAEELLQEANEKYEEENGSYPGYNTPEYNQLNEEAIAQAKSELKGSHGGMVMYCYLKILKPVIVKPKGGTYFEYIFDEDTGEETGSYLELYNAVVARYGATRGRNIWEAIVSSLDPEFTAFEFEQAARSSDYFLDGDYEGGVGPVLSAIWQAAGFDGIIMDANAAGWGLKMPAKTTHYIVFNPNQVKSAIGNTGQYSPDDNRITAGKATFLRKRRRC